MHNPKHHFIRLLVVLLALPVLLKVTGVISASHPEELLMRVEMAASYQSVLLQPFTELDIQVTDADYSHSIGLGTQRMPSFQNDITALILSDAGWDKSLNLFLSTEVQNIQNNRSSLDTADASVAHVLQLSRFTYAPAPQDLDKQIQVWDAGYIDNDINLVPPSLIANDVATIADTAVAIPSALLSPTSTATYISTTSPVVTATLTLVPTNAVISEPTITDMPSPSPRGPIMSFINMEGADRSVLIPLIVIFLVAIVGPIIYKSTRRTVNTSTNTDDTFIASNVSIRNILAELYRDTVSMRRVADDAGLKTARIEFGSSAVNNWQAILLEAAGANRVDVLLKVALQEYPENAELFQAIKKLSEKGA